MYSNPYEAGYRAMDNTTSILYANNVTYSNGVYTLTDTNAQAITSADWSSLSRNGLINNHYTCFTTSRTCEEVYYIYNTYDDFFYYLKLSNSKNIKEALVDMLGTDEGDASVYNTTSSTIKGNKNEEGTLDYWYFNEIEDKGFGDYIEDTVWCNDRNIYSLGGFEPNGGPTNVNSETDGMEAMLWFSETTSYLEYTMGLSSSVTPKLSCSRNIDKFSVGLIGGNADLDYPVGLLTLNEIMIAGGSIVENDEYYLYNEAFWWSGAPFLFGNASAYVADVYYGGDVYNNIVDGSAGVRPSVSLKPGFSLVGDGEGTSENPFIVE